MFDYPAYYDREELCPKCGEWKHEDYDCECETENDEHYEYNEI